MRRVRRTAQEIEFRRILRVLALERDRLRAHGQINAIQPVERKRLAVRTHRPCPADVDGAQLAAFEEKRPARFLVIWQFNGFDRHHAADHQPVEIGERPAQFARHKQIGDLECFPELLGGQGRDVLRPGHPADRVFEHAVSFSKNQAGGKPRAALRKSGNDFGMGDLEGCGRMRRTCQPDETN